MNFKKQKQKVKFFITRYFNGLIYLIDSIYITNIVNRSNQIVIIYTIGKVGSTTLLESLKNSSINIPIFHIHSLNKTNIYNQKQYYLNSERKSVPFHLIRSSVLEKRLKFFTGKLFIITLIREPIGRELSSVFQDALIFKNFYKKNIGSTNEIIERKINALTEELPEEKWFNTELKEVFNINIFDLKFEPKKGYIFYEKKNISFLLLRLEDLNKVFMESMAKMFKNKHIDLINKNIGKDKFYSNSYNNFKSMYGIDKDKIKRIVNSRFIKKFYFDKIDSIRNTWILK